MTDDKPQLLRLRKKHGTGQRSSATAADGERLVRAQSLQNAVIGGLVTIVIFSLFWISISALTNRFYPWMTVVQGILIGFVIRRAGHGVDWRFPATAALLAAAGSFLAHVIVAAAYTAETFGTDTFAILRAVTSMTWPVFLDEVLTVADVFYAVVAASFAAFLANRRLNRMEFYALRLWRAQSDGHQ